MMEAANTSETSVNFYQTTLLNNPEDSHLHIRRRENLKTTLFCPLYAFTSEICINVTLLEISRGLQTTV
jgi:hypothetical protein